MDRGEAKGRAERCKQIEISAAEGIVQDRSTIKAAPPGRADDATEGQYKGRDPVGPRPGHSEEETIWTGIDFVFFSGTNITPFR